jgi:hypothetical protein
MANRGSGSLERAPCWVLRVAAGGWPDGWVPVPGLAGRAGGHGGAWAIGCLMVPAFDPALSFAFTDHEVQQNCGPAEPAVNALPACVIPGLGGVATLRPSSVVTQAGLLDVAGEAFCVWDSLILDDMSAVVSRRAVGSAVVS